MKLLFKTYPGRHGSLQLSSLLYCHTLRTLVTLLIDVIYWHGKTCKHIQEPKPMLTHRPKTKNHWLHFRNRCLNHPYYLPPPGPCHGWAGASSSRLDGSTAPLAASLVQKDTCHLWILQNPCGPFQVSAWIGYLCGTTGKNPDISIVMIVPHFPEQCCSPA